MAWYPRRIFQWLANGISNPEVGPQYAGGSGSSEATDVSDERAFQISAVWSCVRLISESVSCLPLGFYEKREEGRVQLESDHRLVRMLKYKPNQTMTDVEFREAMTTQLVLWGNAYASIARDTRGNPISLLPLIPGKMEVVRLPDKSIEYKYYTEEGIETFEQRDIFHLKGFSAEGLVGFSPLAIVTGKQRQ